MIFFPLTVASVKITGQEDEAVRQTVTGIKEATHNPTLEAIQWI